jgi:hypothetical protein
VMKIARLLCALWVCGSLAIDARAADSPARNGAAVSPVKTGQAAGSAAPGGDKGLKAGRRMAQESTQAGANKGDGSKGPNAAMAASPGRASNPTPRVAGHPLARTNADRLHWLRPAKERGRDAPTSNRRIGPTATVASGKVSARGQGVTSASPQAPPAPLAATNAARVPSSVAPLVRRSTVGGPRAAGPGRLGGPATSQIAHNGTIGGTQLRRKF